MPVDIDIGIRPTVVEFVDRHQDVEIVYGGQTTIVNNGSNEQPKSAMFGTPTKPWIVNHNLNYVPQAWVTDLAGSQIAIEIVLTVDRITVIPAEPMVGYIYYR